MMVRYSGLVLFLTLLGLSIRLSSGVAQGRTLLSMHASDTITLNPPQSITFKLNKNDNNLAIRVDEMEQGASITFLDKFWNKITFEQTYLGVEMTVTKSKDQSKRSSVVFLPYSIKLEGRKSSVHCKSGNVVISYKAYSATDLLCDSSAIIPEDSNHEDFTMECSHDQISPEGDAQCTVNLVCPANYVQLTNDFRCNPPSEDRMVRHWSGIALCEPLPDIMDHQCTSEDFDLDDEDECPYSSMEVINYMFKNDQLDAVGGLGRSGGCAGRSSRWFTRRCRNFCTTHGKIKVRTCRGKGWSCVACVRRMRCTLRTGACYLP